MTIDQPFGRHRLPTAVLSALARGTGGVGAIWALRESRRSRTLLLLRTVVDLAESNQHPQAGLVRRAFRELADIQCVAPDTVQALLDYPFVQTWAANAAVALRTGRGTPVLGELATFAVAAAVSAKVDLTIPVNTGDRLILPSLGTAELTGDAVRVRTTEDGAELRAGTRRVIVPADPAEPAIGWQPLARITVDPRAGITFLLDTSAPAYLPATLQARPDLSVPAVDLWRRRIGEGWAMLAEHHPETSVEVGAGVRVLAPMPAQAGAHSSVTLADAFGCVFLSLPRDATSAALVLAHELQHAKLAVLLDLLPLLDVRSDHRYYAPWRDDPRPLIGLLHGVYAHLAVAGFWRRQQHVLGDPEAKLTAQIQFARWRIAAAEACSTIVDSSGLAEIGRAFVAEMADVLAEWASPAVPAEAMAGARRALAEHRSRWVAVNGAAQSGWDRELNSRP